MDFINRARRGSANKEQGERSCVVSHNKFIVIDNFAIYYFANSDCLQSLGANTSSIGKEKKTISSTRTATAQ